MTHLPLRTQEELELEALAAIGEAMLFNNRGNAAEVAKLKTEGMRFLSANVVRKKLSDLCHNAAHDPNWRVSRTTRKQMLGRGAINEDE